MAETDDQGQLLVALEPASPEDIPGTPMLKKIKLSSELDHAESIISMGPLTSLGNDASEVNPSIMSFSAVEGLTSNTDVSFSDAKHGTAGAEAVLVQSCDLLSDDAESGLLMSDDTHNVVDPSLVGGTQSSVEELTSASDAAQCIVAQAPVGTTPQFATLNGQVLQIVQLPQSEASQLSSDNDLQLQLFANGHKVYQLVPASNISKTELCSVLAINPASELDLTNQNKQDSSILQPADGSNFLTSRSGILEVGSSPSSSSQTDQSFIPIAPRPLSDDVPAWAARLKDCQKIGKAYRGWVETEIELDFLLTLHKQQTQSFWGTRQSPCPAKPSTRLMWKSQYVPFDGIPFINAGSRAVVMECQFGPRRKGGPALAKRLDGSLKTHADFRQTCPARIYVKRVKKFPQFAVNPRLDKKSLHIAMAKSFQLLKEAGMNAPGVERFYVELPLASAHEFHLDVAPDVSVHNNAPSRLDPRVSDRVRMMVAAGETRLYVIRKALRRFVEKELFECVEEVPPKHNLSFYPTVNDLQNHIHHAIKDIENGLLAITSEADVNFEAIAKEGLEGDSSGTDSIIANAVLEGSSSEEIHQRRNNLKLLRPESVTVTLTKNPDHDGEHVVSRVETHMSDGTMRVSSSLNEETAKLLARLHPDMFPSSSLVKIEGEQRPVKQESVLSAGVPEELHTDEEAQLISLHPDATSLHPANPDFLEHDPPSALDDTEIPKEFTVIIDENKAIMGDADSDHISPPSSPPNRILNLMHPLT